MIRFRQLLNEDFLDTFKSVNDCVEKITNDIELYARKNGTLEFILSDINPNYPQIVIILAPIGGNNNVEAHFNFDLKRRGYKYDTVLTFYCIIIHPDGKRFAIKKDLLKRNFAHEFTHYLDYVKKHLRGRNLGSVEDRAPYKKRSGVDRETAAKLYYNIGTELNAHVNEMILEIKELLKDGHVVYNVEEMIDLVSLHGYHTGRYEYFLSLLTPNNFKRVAKRLAAFFNKEIKPKLNLKNAITRSGHAII